MKKFEIPEIEVICFDADDIIVTSGGPCDDHWCSQCHGETD